MTTKEFRTISSEDVRNMCIKNNWYTNGSVEDYCTLLNYVDERGSNVRDNDILNFAIDIFNHSSMDWREYGSKEDCVSCITYALLNDCIHHFMEIVEM